MINNKTKIYISISKFPGSTGSLLHNTGYKILNLNCIYVPLKCENYNDLELFINNLNFKGISVSMPYKSKVIKFLDQLDISSKKTGVANTILRNKNKLKGFNTDFLALRKILKKKKYKIKDCLLLGNGATSRTSYEVLKELKIKKIYLSSRNKKKYKSWNIRKSDKVFNWERRNPIKSDLLINCTPLGMINLNVSPKKILSKDQHKYIIDFPINKFNKLSNLARKFRINYVSGIEISFHQGFEQFRIYTNKKISENKLKKKLNYNFYV